MREVNWDFIKSCLRFRKQQKRLTNLGYRIHETDWEIHRGGMNDHVIVDAIISECGKYVYTKLERRGKE